MFCTTSHPNRISDNNRAAGAPKWNVRIGGYTKTRIGTRLAIDEYDAKPVWAWDEESARLLAVSRTCILDGSRNASVSPA